MSIESPQAKLWGELSSIDYFLDQLARGVERGEVPRASYDTMAPRYLVRRTVLVAALTGSPSAQATSQPMPQAGQQQPWTSQPLAQPQRVARPLSQARPARQPVSWTTVLLFLGSFLVIVASAIFAVAVWQMMSPVLKLAFMGALTVGFYTAGYYARAKLGLKAGSAALTAVASAMLLFDCWIVIDGFGMQSIPAWTVALFFCSLVYWFTEVRLGDRFYGVAGAAAQVGWWWLLGAGLHLQYPVRFAGIALVALLWQLTAERVSQDSPFASLASVLQWAAPVVAIGSFLALLGDTITVGSPDTVTLVANATAAAAGAVIFWRTKLPLPRREYVAAATQIPLLVAALLSAQTPGWPLAALLLVMAGAYAVASLLSAGAPFAVLALVSEFALVGVVCNLFDASPHVIPVVFAVLALTWVLASRFAAAATRAVRDDVSWSELSAAGEFAFVARKAGAVLLVLASALAIEAGRGVALSGSEVTSADVVTCAAVLAAWALSTLVNRSPRLATAASLWSLYALAALLAWALPELQSATYALALLGACAAWCFARSAMARFYRVDAELFGWLYRTLAALVVLGGLFAQAYWFAREPLWAGAVLAFGATLFFAVDAVFGGPRVSAAAAGIAGTGAAFLAGHAFAEASTPDTGALAVLAATPESFAAVTAAGGAAVLAMLGALVRHRLSARAGVLALAAAVTGTLFTAFALDEPYRLAFALALLTGAWVAAGLATRQRALAGVAGLTAFAAAIALVAASDGSPWLTVGVAGIACLVLNLPAFTHIAGPEGRLAVSGETLALAGIGGVLAVTALGSPLAYVPELTGPTAWLAFGQHGIAALLAIAGVAVTAQAVRWKVEAGLYVGLGVLLLALFAETHALSFTSAELYSTPLAAYLVGMGYLYAWRVPGRGVPAPLDVAAVLIGLGVPLARALTTSGPEMFAHTAWSIGLSLVFIAGGIVGRCRIYLFGGAAALALVAGWRTMSYLAEFWWLTLGLIGTAMLVIALTWERQRMMLSETQRRLRDGFENWR